MAQYLYKGSWLKAKRHYKPCRTKLIGGIVLKFDTLIVLIFIINVSISLEIALASGSANSDCGKSIETSKPEIRHSKNYNKIMSSYLEVASRLKDFLSVQTFSGKGKVSPLNNHPVQEFISRTGEILSDFENTPQLLDVIGEGLEKIIAFYGMQESNPNRSALKATLESGDEIHIDKSWQNEKEGPFFLYSLFYSQKNHTIKTLTNPYSNPAVGFKKAIDHNKMTHELVENLINSFEAAIYRLPSKDQYDVLIRYIAFIELQTDQSVQRQKIKNFIKHVLVNESAFNENVTRSLIIFLNPTLYDFELATMFLEIILNTDYKGEIKYANHKQNDRLKKYIDNVERSSLSDIEKNQLNERAMKVIDSLK